jgi:L-2,4-diaminobutyric acid acetyltransferase
MFTLTQNRADKGGRQEARPLLLRKPRPADGARVWQLVADCPPLDRNSMYCNLLQCSDFADTCVLAELRGRVAGWVSGYRPPDDPGALFVWQVAVHQDARSMGLAKKMLSSLLERDGCDDVDYLKTTITPENDASRALFQSFADKYGAPLRESSGFDAEKHFRGRHDSERLITIGPFSRQTSAARRAGSAA